MKKVIASSLLGIALLAAGPAVKAEKPDGVEPRSGNQTDAAPVPSPLDLARWLARRMNEGIPVPIQLRPSPPPKSAPVTDPTPNDGDVVCPVDRVHCPVG